MGRLKLPIANGDYASDSEYVQDLSCVISKKMKSFKPPKLLSKMALVAGSVTEALTI
ncbi:MAG: hypothetical protein ACJAUP_002905 [Cellvibrionaceae bacterium]|jgi:hypothetical protein